MTDEHLIAEALRQENERLKAEIKEVKKYQYEQENKELKAEKNKYYQQTLDDEIQINELYQEIERLKKQLEFDSRYNDMQAELDYGEKLIEKYKSYLQEIKAIVCSNGEIIDTQGRKDILKLITKTEEE